MSIFSAATGFDAANNSAKAAKNQQALQGNVAKGYGNLFNKALPQANDLLANLDAYGVGHAVGSALNNLNADPAKRIASFGSSANEAATNEAANNTNYLKAFGYGDGATGGVASGSFRAASAATNKFAANEMDPEEIQRKLFAVLQSYGMSVQQIQQLLGGFSGGVYSQPTVQQAPNPLAAILGQAAGGYASAAGKKMGGRV